jgi:hypothetical protein
MINVLINKDLLVWATSAPEDTVGLLYKVSKPCGCNQEVVFHIRLEFSTGYPGAIWLNVLKTLTS